MVKTRRFHGEDYDKPLDATGIYGFPMVSRFFPVSPLDFLTKPWRENTFGLLCQTARC